MMKSMLSFLCIALSSLGCLYAAEVSPDAQWPLVIELTLKNAPGFFSYHDIGALAQVKKDVRRILLETAPYRKAFIIEHFSARLPKENIAWHKYATACAFISRMLSIGTVSVVLERGQLAKKARDGECKMVFTTITMIKDAPTISTITESGHVLWHKPKSVGPMLRYEQNRMVNELKREYLCSQPAFDDRGNAYVWVQESVRDYKDSPVYYVLKSNGTGEKKDKLPF